MPKKLWQFDAQTAGKHLLLRHYLDGWFPILSRRHKRLLFIDGFAGPGEYENGQKGSPLVAMECVRRHRQEGRLRGVEIVFVFLESRHDRAEHLRSLIKRQEHIEHTESHVLEGEFQDHMRRILDLLDEQNKQLAPAFVMIDPFGVKGIPMELIGEILKNDRSECLISFMYEPIRRFHAQPEFTPHLDKLFGTEDWRSCLGMPEGPDKKQFLHDLYRRQLKHHAAKHVVALELWKGNKHVYTLHFATGSLKGCDLMKESIWRIDDSGGFAFRSSIAGTPSLFGGDTELLKQQLQEEFGSKWTRIEQIEEFVMSDKTQFYKGQLRNKTLRPLERDGRIEVRRPQGSKGFPSGKNIQIRFR